VGSWRSRRRRATSFRRHSSGPWRHLDQYDVRFRFSTWLFRIAHNVAIDYLRRRRQPTVSLELGEDSEGDEIRLDPADPRRGPLGDLAQP